MDWPLEISATLTGKLLGGLPVYEVSAEDSERLLSVIGRSEMDDTPAKVEISREVLETQRKNLIANIQQAEQKIAELSRNGLHWRGMLAYIESLLKPGE